MEINRKKSEKNRTNKTAENCSKIEITIRIFVCFQKPVKIETSFFAKKTEKG